MIKKITLTKQKKDRQQVLKSYIKFASGMTDKLGTTPEALALQDNQCRGACIMNATLSGNIFNQFDIYQSGAHDEMHSPRSIYTSQQRGLNYLINFLSQICL